MGSLQRWVKLAHANVLGMVLCILLHVACFKLLLSSWIPEPGIICRVWRGNDYWSLCQFYFHLIPFYFILTSLYVCACACVTT